MKRRAIVAASLVLFVLIIIGSMLLVYMNPTVSPEAKQYAYTIVKSYSHDPNAFTEGLLYVDGFLYESTGLEGSSTLRRVNLTSGNVLAEVALPRQYFGEGIAVVNDLIIQLTWQSHVGIVYDKKTLDLVTNFSYSSEGWGLTFDGNRLIMSNGSDYLLFLDRATFQQVGEVQVHDANLSVRNLNELEYVNGDVYANIFQERKIAIINPETGEVKGWIDLTSLQGASVNDPEAVLNGIAYDVEDDRLFVTGKFWPKIYEIKLVPSPS